MKKKKKEYFIIIALGIVFLLMIGRFIFKLSITGSEQTNSQIEKEKIDQYTFKTLKRKKSGKQLKKLEWNRDPFYLDKYIGNETTQKKKKKKKKTAQEELELTGIIWDEDNPMAIISGNILEKNESYGKYIVEEIRKNRVILNNEKGKKKVLEME